MDLLQDNKSIFEEFNPKFKDVNSGFEQRNVKGCKTVKSKEGVFKAIKKPPAMEIPKACVNKRIYEKDGEKYCISGEGNDLLECDDKGKAKRNREVIICYKCCSDKYKM